MNRKKMDVHYPAKNSQGFSLTLSHRSRANGKGKERQLSDDDTLVGSSSRYNSLHANRSSMMQTINESAIDDTRLTYNSQNIEPRQTSALSGVISPPHRHATFDNDISEGGQSEPEAAQRSSLLNIWKAKKQNNPRILSPNLGDLDKFQSTPAMAFLNMNDALTSGGNIELDQNDWSQKRDPSPSTAASVKLIPENESKDQAKL